MNWKSTVALLILAGAAGAWFFKGDAWLPRLGTESARPGRASPAARALDALAPDDITSVRVAFASGDPLEVRRAGARAAWTMPGNWPPRVPEVEELVRTLGTLRARFHPEPLGENPDLKPYGLAPDQKPVAVTVEFQKPGAAGTGTLNLVFGEPPATAGETAFTRPGYLRVATTDENGKEHLEVVKLGPDVVPVVRRSADAYRRRQLFPSTERVKLVTSTPPANPLAPPSADAPITVTLPGEATESVTVTQTVPGVLGFDFSALGTFTLARSGALPEPGVSVKGGEAALRPDRLADVWRLVSPAADNVEPERLRAVLAAVADLWVEEFVHPAPDEAKLGFGTAPRSVTVKPRGGEPVTVRFGAVAKTVERDETVTVPGGPPGAPPRQVTQKVKTEHRYARVDGNPQVFTVAADKLGDVFAAPAGMADPRVARFDSAEVQRVVVTRPGQPPLTLTRKKADPKAARPEDRSDHWLIAARPNDLPADSTAVNELIEQLSRLRADGPDRRTHGAVPEGRYAATVTAREARADGEPDAPERQYELRFGAPDARRLLPVSLAGRPAVTLIDNKLGPDDPSSWIGALLFPETVAGLLERPTVAFRDRKLFDTTGASLLAVAVTNGFTLKRDALGWKLVAPVASEADPGKAVQLAQTLTELRATEYLAESPTAEQLAAFGLATPTHTIALSFDTARSYTLEVGGPRPGKPEVFARLDGGAVFGLPAAATGPIATGAIGLLPLKVWAAGPDQIASVQITRQGDSAANSFTLTRTGAEWKLTGPFTAPVPQEAAQQLVATLGTLTAERYQSLAATNPAEFGFDKPLVSVKVSYTEKKAGAAEEVPVTHTVQVGGTTPDGAGRYARLDGPNAPVFVVPAGFVAAAQTPPLELPNKLLLALDPGRIASVRVAAGKPEEAVTLTRDAAGKWAAEGATFGIDPGRLAELTGAAARPRVTRLAAYGDAIKWAEFGLETPDTRVTVTTAGEKPETHTIALGNPDPSGARFARIDDTPAVAVVPAAVAETLTRKRFDYADRTLLKFDPTTLVAVTRTRDKEELELAPSAAAGWDVVKPAKQKADAPFVDELAEALGRLRAERVAAFGKKDEVFKQFGLEPAAAVLALTVGDKAEQKVLRIGNPVDASKPDGERYAAVESPAPEALVGVLPAALANKLLAPARAFRDRTLANFVDADRVVLERGDRKVTFAKTGAVWKVVEPVAADAEAAALADLVTDLGGLRAEAWVGDRAKDVKQFGLDKPEASWTVSFGDRPVLALQVGKPQADGRVPVAVEGKDLIGVVSPAMGARLLAEYRQRRVWAVDAAQAERVEVALGDSRFAFEKAGPLWSDPAKPGEAIDFRVVNELVGTLGALRAERYAADKDADPTLYGLEKPEVTVTVVPRGAARATLEIGGAVGGTDGKQRYARVAGPGRTVVFVLSAADTARLTRDRGAYTMKK
ncbi:DUF4340 domain-containing protein [Gemmata sp.]|uniref:DUF4340 domain-containing protein n=1 Tax=Gemmata sp. TaxID=1914242 RepID=UPI003F71673B